MEHPHAASLAREVGLSGRPHKVMYVTTDLRTGGAEAMLTRVVTAEPRLADELIVVSLLPAEAYADRLRAAGIGVVEFNFRRPLGAAADLIGLARLIAREQPDIVQGWMYHGDLAALLALALSGRRRRTGLIWSIRCSTLDLSRYGLALRLVVKRLCTLSVGSVPDRGHTTNSDAGRASNPAPRLPSAPRRKSCFNGIELEWSSSPTPPRAAVRRQCVGIPEDPIVARRMLRVLIR